MQNRQKLKTVLVGFGKIAHGNASDKVMAQRMPYSTHSQVLVDHPLFDWKAVVDPSGECQKLAREKWHIPAVASQLSDLEDPEQYDVAIVSTPPSSRPNVLNTLPALKGILIEKPLADSFSAGRAFVTECERRGVVLQVNLLRRADKTTRKLAGSELCNTIGSVQTAFGVYSNGLTNNGTHIIDLARMLLRQEIKAVQSFGTPFSESPIPGDINVPFNLQFESGLTVSMSPLKLHCYRENGLEIWGESGHLSYMNSGFSIAAQRVIDSALQSGERELELKTSRHFPATLGEAFYDMYSNLADAIQLGSRLFSPGSSALATMLAVESILISSQNQGRLIQCNSLEQVT